MFSELFANNLLVKFLRGDRSRDDLIVSMVGPKLGERLLQVAGGDGRLLAALGVKTGLTGTLVAVEPDEATAARVLDEATKGGVLADVHTAQGTFPYAPAAFDIVVVPFPADDGPALAAHLGEAFRVLRDGGRVAVITRGTARAGDATSGAPTTPPIVTAIQQQGFRAARVLAERSGLAFYEGVKK